jgi:hypothetical protein
MPTYDELMEQFTSIVQKRMEENAEFYQPRIVHTVETYLGRGKKFTEASQDQIEQMILIVEELKEL